MLKMLKVLLLVPYRFIDSVKKTLVVISLYLSGDFRIL